MKIEFERQFKQGINLFQTGQLEAALALWQKLRVKSQKSKNSVQKGIAQK